MPRVSKEERETRDALIMRMFIAGVPYRDICTRPGINLSVGMIHKVVKAQMKKSALRRDFIVDNAYEVHVERLESLYASNYAKAVSGTDPKAAELCRRLLGDLGKIHGLYDGAASGSQPPPRVDDGDDELDGDEEDELTAFRKRTRGA